MICSFEGQKLIPGGAGVTIANLAALDAKVHAVGVVGDDAPGRELLRAFAGMKGCDAGGVLKLRGLHTTTKTRIMAGDRHTIKQQVIRLDHASEDPLNARHEKRLLALLDRAAKEAQAMVVSDYGYNVLCESVISRVVDLARKIPVIVDSRFNLGKFKGVTALTPNEAEAEACLGRPLSRDGSRSGDGKELLDRMNLQALLITRGNQGMALFQRSSRWHSLGIVGTEDIVDVTGAGDAVASAFALAIAAGASYLEAAHIANHCAGIVVMKPGAATASRKELVESLETRCG